MALGITRGILVRHLEKMGVISVRHQFVCFVFFSIGGGGSSGREHLF